MEIVWNNNKVPFEIVDVGHTFIYNDDIFMKTTSIYNADDNIVVNAVNIEDGIIITFYDDDLVTPVVGKFIMN